MDYASDYKGTVCRIETDRAVWNRHARPVSPALTPSSVDERQRVLALAMHRMIDAVMPAGRLDGNPRAWRSVQFVPSLSHEQSLCQGI